MVDAPTGKNVVLLPTRVSTPVPLMMRSSACRLVVPLPLAAEAVVEIGPVLVTVPVDVSAPVPVL